jgi:hypothetical protein
MFFQLIPHYFGSKAPPLWDFQTASQNLGINWEIYPGSW